MRFGEVLDNLPESVKKNIAMTFRNMVADKAMEKLMAKYDELAPDLGADEESRPAFEATARLGVEYGIAEAAHFVYSGKKEEK